MLASKVLDKSDQLVYKLFLGLKEKAKKNRKLRDRVQFILEKNSIKQEDNGIKLTIIEPYKDANKKKEFLITNTGEVKLLKENFESEKEEETKKNFINRTSYIIESCKEEENNDLLYSMRIKKPKITLLVKKDSNNSSDEVKIIRTLVPSIITIDNNGQIFEVITQDKETMIESQDVHVK